MYRAVPKGPCDHYSIAVRIARRAVIYRRFGVTQSRVEFTYYRSAISVHTLDFKRPLKLVHLARRLPL